eukprot:3263559-Pyramimonas_sp.AAC.1
MNGFGKLREYSALPKYMSPPTPASRCAAPRPSAETQPWTKLSALSSSAQSLAPSQLAPLRDTRATELISD